MIYEKSCFYSEYDGDYGFDDNIIEGKEFYDKLNEDEQIEIDDFINELN